MRTGFSPNALIRSIRIPTLPQVAMRCCAMATDPQVGTREIGALLTRDPMLAGRVLEIANSATYALARTVTTTEQAASVLGTRALRNLTLQVSIINEFSKLSSIPGFDVYSFWKHSIMTAVMSSRLARRCFSRLEMTPDEVYVSGLLHDLGRIVLLDELGTDYVNVMQRGATCRPDIDHELDVFGYTHMEVGATVVARWKLARETIKTVLYHHDEKRAAEDPLIATVACADVIASSAEASTPLDEIDVPGSVLECLGFSPEDVAEVHDEAIQLWPEIEV